MSVSPIHGARRGMSMAEVLVALFIMALGVIAILTLFPVGMLQIGQALKDDRTAQCAAQADSFMRAYWKQFVVQKQAPGDANMDFTNPGCAFFNPDAGSGGNPHGLPPTPPGSPSYPVVFDPMGYASSWGPNTSPSFQFWVGNVNVPRRPLINIASPLRTCSIMDGMDYNANNGAANVIDRELRYNWLWVLQRPQGTLPTENTASMTIVVFDKRSFIYVPPGAENAFTSLTPAANGNGGAGSTSVSFPTGTQLGVQKGGWIADMTVLPPNVAGGRGTVLNANFYRVVSVTDNGVTVDVELQQPIQDTAASPLPSESRTWVVMANVSEVFVRPNLENQ
ncbi:MAG TPA: hypothetical protein VN641_05955 [Urbifossiella sp.]|nr:hypothetical protein [Urbifossiella sp.]